MELVSKTAGTASATLSATAQTTATTDDGEFAALLAGLTGSAASRKISEANAALPALKVTAAAVTSATAASSTDTTTTSSSSSDDDLTGDATASTTASTAAAMTPYTFTQADQYSPEVMSVGVQNASGAMSYRPVSSATTTQLDLANAMAPLDPNAATDSGIVDDIPVVGPMSYTVVGYQPRASASDPFVPIYGPAPTSYT